MGDGQRRAGTAVAGGRSPESPGSSSLRPCKLNRIFSAHAEARHHSLTWSCLKRRHFEQQADVREMPGHVNIVFALQLRLVLAVHWREHVNAIGIRFQSCTTILEPLFPTTHSEQFSLLHHHLLSILHTNMLIRPMTPPEHIPRKEWRTPARVALRQGFKLMDQSAIRQPSRPGLNRSQLLSILKIPRTTAYRICKSQTPRRHPIQENRGRKQNLTQRDINYLELIIQREGWTARTLTFEALAQELDKDISAGTIRRHLRSLNYRRCLACQKSWVHPRIAAQRVKLAKEMLQRFPTPDDWKQVRFSDETHLGFGPEGRAYILRKPEEVDHPSCVQQTKTPKQKDEKRLHTWAVIGYDYKSELYFYDNNSSNGKMDQKTYIRLLEQEPLPGLEILF